jgi:hypothetical protein
VGGCEEQHEITLTPPDVKLCAHLHCWLLEDTLGRQLLEAHEWVMMQEMLLKRLPHDFAKLESGAKQLCLLNHKDNIVKTEKQG